MTATELGNKPASKMTYRQKIVLAATLESMRGFPRCTPDYWAHMGVRVADAILAREARRTTEGCAEAANEK